MKYILALLSALLCGSAYAQDAKVVTTCGTLPLAYPAGSTQLMTVDTNGRLCGYNLAAGITIGMSVITGGTDKRVLFNDNGVVGESAGLTFSKGNGGSTANLTVSGTANIAGIAIFNNNNATGFGYISADGIYGNNNGNGAFTLGGSTVAVRLSGNGYIFSPAAATLHLGQPDAAVAVAQTTRVQSVVAGTAAANGANWTFIGSLPTGTGTSGDIIFQTGIKTGSGTTQGTATTSFTIKGETGALEVGGARTGIIYGGTAAGNELQFGTGGSVVWKIAAANAGQHLYAVTDGTNDIGGATGSRPRSIYTSTVFGVGTSAAITSGGAQGIGFVSTSTANFGVFFGSGAPTISAAKGSIYLRSDGSGVNDRAYINTNGSTTWTAIVTVG